MLITVYRNKYNDNKFLEVHNDGFRHNSVKQFMKWDSGKVSPTGDGKLHRMSKSYLSELLKDYIAI